MLFIILNSILFSLNILLLYVYKQTCHRSIPNGDVLNTSKALYISE